MIVAKFDVVVGTIDTDAFLASGRLACIDTRRRAAESTRFLPRIRIHRSTLNLRSKQGRMKSDLNKRLLLYKFELKLQFPRLLGLLGCAFLSLVCFRANSIKAFFADSRADSRNGSAKCKRYMTFAYYALGIFVLIGICNLRGFLDLGGIGFGRRAITPEGF
jgi:hypothetical protein